MTTRTPEALAMFIQGNTYSSKAVSMQEGVSEESHRQTPRLDVSTAQLKQLDTHLRRLVVQYRGLLELQRLSATDKLKMSGGREPRISIIRSLDEYPSDDINLTQMIVYPPKLEPIPVKPLFFDLAWNYIDYAGRTPIIANGTAGEKSSETTPEQKKETKRGWFGFGGR